MSSVVINSHVPLDFDAEYVGAKTFAICVILLLSSDNRTILFRSRDRPNQFRRQYPGSAGPPPGRDFPPRYNRSPGRYDMSPPHNKRVRRDWYAILHCCIGVIHFF